MDLGGDTEFESEIEAVVGALEAIEESDAIEALATWKQTRAAMAQEKLNRGLRTPVHQHSNSTSVTKNVPKPDLANLAGLRDATIVGRLDISAETAQKNASKLLEQMLAYGLCHVSWT